MPHLNLTVIHLEYDKAKYGASFDSLREYLANANSTQVNIIRVDNKRPLSTPSQADNRIWTMGGDNTFHEFTGWQAGFEAVQSMEIETDVLLLTNDTFLAPGPSFLQDYNSDEFFQDILSRRCAVGRIDSHGTSLQIGKYRLNDWICTNAILIPFEAAIRLGDLVSVRDDITDFLPPHYDASNHMLGQVPVPPDAFDAGDIDVEFNFPKKRYSDLRLLADQSFVPADLGMSADGRELSLMLRKLEAGRRSVRRKKAAGWYDDGWMARGLHVMRDFEASTLRLTGTMPVESVREMYKKRGGLKISAYDDSRLFVSTSNTNRHFRSAVVSWFTERWRKRIDINEDTWPVFRSKTQAIMNEMLLSARLAELGYPLRRYGNKVYY